jgi:hypothetical protein
MTRVDCDAKFVQAGVNTSDDNINIEQYQDKMYAAKMK